MQAELFNFEVIGQLTEEKKKRPIKAIKGYTEAVSHILESYLKKKGTRYPFSGKHGTIVKRALSCYALSGTKALWDVFLETDWTWKNKDGDKVKVACDLTIWESKWTFMVDMPEWKRKREEYDKVGVVPVELKPVLGAIKSMPKAPDHQALKVAAATKVPA